MESAALSAAVVRATDADREHVTRVNQLLKDAVAEDDPQSYHRQSRIFHMVLVEHAQRARLHEDHGEMLQAFLDRDVDRLLATSTAHHHRLNEVVATED